MRVLKEQSPTSYQCWCRRPTGCPMSYAASWMTPKAGLNSRAGGAMSTLTDIGRRLYSSPSLSAVPVGRYCKISSHLLVMLGEPGIGVQEPAVNNEKTRQHTPLLQRHNSTGECALEASRALSHTVTEARVRSRAWPHRHTQTHTHTRRPLPTPNRPQ